MIWTWLGYLVKWIIIYLNLWKWFNHWMLCERKAILEPEQTKINNNEIIQVLFHAPPSVNYIQKQCHWTWTCASETGQMRERKNIKITNKVKKVQNWTICWTNLRLFLCSDDHRRSKPSSRRKDVSCFALSMFICPVWPDWIKICKLKNTLSILGFVY